jgi:hypothetical protein
VDILREAERTVRSGRFAIELVGAGGLKEQSVAQSARIEAAGRRDEPWW